MLLSFRRADSHIGPTLFRTSGKIDGYGQNRRVQFVSRVAPILSVVHSSLANPVIAADLFIPSLPLLHGHG